MDKRIAATAAGTLVAALALTGCSSFDPLEAESNDGGKEVIEEIVVGSQDYYSNEIIAEVYAQALEDAGFKVDRQFRVGQREVYLPEVEQGRVDLFPEYTGNLLQYWVPDTDAHVADDVYRELVEATPSGLEVLEQSTASDQDSYTVTREFAERWGLTDLQDLTKVDEPMVLGGNSELETRPYGPEGLKEYYGVDVGFTPIEDSGGPLTLKALSDGDIQLANIYTADPAIAANDLVVLSDSQGLFLASNVVPLASENLSPEAIEVINRVSAKLTPQALVEMNARSVDEELPAKTIAADWLKENGF